MRRAGQWRSAWAWRCPQRRAKRSPGGGRPPGTAVRIGEEVGDGAGGPGVIAGGAQRGACAAGGNARLQTCNTPFRRLRSASISLRSRVGLRPIRRAPDSTAGLPVRSGTPSPWHCSLFDASLTSPATPVGGRSRLAKPAFNRASRGVQYLGKYGGATRAGMLRAADRHGSCRG